jgi:hypothetical protein
MDEDNEAVIGRHYHGDGRIFCKGTERKQGLPGVVAKQFRPHAGNSYGTKRKVEPMLKLDMGIVRKPFVPCYGGTEPLGGSQRENGIA